jgi:hypothetical protein
VLVDLVLDHVSRDSGNRRYPKLFLEVLAVRANRAQADPKFLRDLPAGSACRDQADDLDFTGSEAMTPGTTGKGGRSARHWPVAGWLGSIAIIIERRPLVPGASQDETREHIRKSR